MIPLMADSLNVFVAASARDAMTEVKDTFLKMHPNNQIELSFGSSGKAYQQFKNGLKYDLFFSADAHYANLIAKDGNAAGQPHVYALGVVALYALDKKYIEKGLEGLSEQKIAHFSIANPKLAPYGAAALEILQKSNLYDGMKDKIVQGENISQALSFVETGAAEVGLVAFSLISKGQKGHYAIVDSSLHSPLEQSFVVTKFAKDNALAKRFAEFVVSDEGRKIIQKYGFGIPQ